jgi:hypothetical protein
MEIDYQIRSNSIKLFWVRDVWPNELSRLVVVWSESGFLSESDLNQRPVGFEIIPDHQPPFSVPINGKPIFLSVFPLHKDGTYGLPNFITSAPSVTVHWELESESTNMPTIIMRFESNRFPVYVPPLSIIWGQADEQTCTLGESKPQTIITSNTQYGLELSDEAKSLLVENGGLYLEPPLSAYHSYIRFNPKVLLVGRGMPSHTILRSLLQQLPYVADSEEEMLTQQIAEHIQPMSAEERRTSIDQIMYFHGLDRDAYGLALAHLLPVGDADVDLLEVILHEPQVDDAAKVAVLERLVSLLDRDSEDKKVRKLLQDIFYGKSSLALSVRMSLAVPLAAHSKWDSIKRSLQDDALGLDLRDALLRAWVKPLTQQAEWKDEETLLNNLLNLFEQRKIDFALQLIAAQTIAAWMQDRQLKPYRSLDGVVALPDDDPQHKRERWAYKKVSRIALNDTFRRKLVGKSLMSISGLSYSGNEAVSIMFYDCLTEFGNRANLQIVTQVFAQTRTDTNYCVQWLVRQVDDDSNSLRLREDCISALIESPTSQPDNIKILNNLAINLLRDTHTDITLRRLALTLISMHRLRAAEDLAPVIWYEPDLREDAILAYQSTPYPEVVRQIVISAKKHNGRLPFDLTRILPVDYPELSSARRMLDALGRVKAVQDQRDELKADLQEFVKNNDFCVTLDGPLGPEMLENVFNTLQSALTSVKTDNRISVNKHTTQQKRYNEKMAILTNSRENLDLRRQQSDARQKDLNSEIRNVQRYLETSEETVKDLKSNLDKLRRQLKKLNRSSEDTSEAREQRHHLEQDINNSEIQLENARNTVERQNNIIANLQRQLEAAQQTIQDAESELRALIGEKQEEEQRHRNSDTELARKIEDNQRQITQLTRARDELAQFETRLQDIKKGSVIANNALSTSQKEWEETTHEVFEVLEQRLAQQRIQPEERRRYIRRRLQAPRDNRLITR